jgi:hypothetical protein
MIDVGGFSVKKAEEQRLQAEGWRLEASSRFNVQGSRL